MPISLLLAASIAVPTAAERTRYPTACSYFSARDLEREDHCVIEGPRGIAIRPAVLRDLAYTDDLATLTFGEHHWFYRHRSGRMVEMATLDNGPDPFEHGLARATIGRHLAYVDRSLRVRIRTTYDFGSPFRGGRATVCSGCVEQRIDRGEHSILVGGRWGMIDRRGRVVVPVTLTAEQLGLVPGRVTGQP